MGPINTLETSLEKISKDLPQLPKNAKKTIAQIVPWLVLLGAVLSLWAAWAMWDWAHVANTYVNWANQISAAYGGTPIATSRLSAGIWIALAVLLAEAVLMFIAFPALRAFKKSGWNLLFILSLVNIVYGIVMMFTNNYGGIGSLIGSVIGTAIGWYFLFQIREEYLGKKHAAAPEAKK